MKKHKKKRSFVDYICMAIISWFLLFLMVLTLAFACLIIIDLTSKKSFSEETNTKDILSAILLDKNINKIHIDKDKVVSELKLEFGVQDEDIAFLSSIRAARLPVDGFDFFNSTRDLIMLTALYMEAKEKWGKAITSEFYDFFVEFCSTRTVQFQKGNTISFFKNYYQTEEAKKRFKLPIY